MSIDWGLDGVAFGVGGHGTKNRRRLCVRVCTTPIKVHYWGVRQVGQFFEVSGEDNLLQFTIVGGQEWERDRKMGGRALTAAPGGRKLYENRIIYAVPQV